MANPPSDPAAELAAIQSIYDTLSPLPQEAQSRVLRYVADWLHIAEVIQPAAPEPLPSPPVVVDAPGTVSGNTPNASRFGTFAELFDSASPTSNADKALVAGYWLQVCQNTDSFDGFSANKELKNLGHGLGNITTAVDNLKNQKPALALQLQKSGKSQQARKVYKVTVAGIKAVEAMIDG